MSTEQEKVSVPGLQATQPTVSVGIPAFNEARHIERVVTGFLQSGYPGLIEVVVADGGSTDGTRAIVEAIAARDPRVRLIHNPRKVQSAGLNQIVAEARGDVFLRADAHCDYAPDYIERCIEALAASRALNVGGAQRFVATTPFQAGVALAVRSPLGSGGAPYRNPRYDGFADTVFLGCFDNSALRELACRAGEGPFDLSQITNQDAELNMRLRMARDEAIYVSSRIRVWYYPRATWRGLWRQYLRYGRGRVMSSDRHPGQAPLRSRLPFLAISAFCFAGLLDILLLGGALRAREMLLAAVLMPFLEGLRVSTQLGRRFKIEIWRGDPAAAPGFLTRSFWCGVALATMPVAHFAGFAFQLVRRRLLRIDAW